MKRRDHDESFGLPTELSGGASAEFFGSDAPKARFGRLRPSRCDSGISILCATTMFPLRVTKLSKCRKISAVTMGVGDFL
jgi:hypothetical protein